MALSDYTQITSMIKLAAATKTVWDIENSVLPEGMAGWESDTRKLKIGDGTSTWMELPYVVDATLTEDQLELLNDINLTNGIVVLDTNGLIPLDVLPDQVKTHIKYMADILSRDATPEEDRHFIYVVLDASGDPTVASGAATYSWDDTNSVWVKLSEFESMDIDFSVFFDKNTDTIDAIDDGISFINYTPEESIILDKSMVKDETYRLVSALTPAQLATIITPEPESAPSLHGTTVAGGTAIGPHYFADGKVGYIVVPDSSVWLSGKLYGYYEVETTDVLDMELCESNRSSDVNTGIVNTQQMCTLTGDDYRTTPNDNAVHYCNDLVYDGCDDFFLPNVTEALFIYENKELLNITWDDFDFDALWTSSQYTSNKFTWAISASGDVEYEYRYDPRGVIPIRRIVTGDWYTVTTNEYAVPYTFVDGRGVLITAPIDLWADPLAFNLVNVPNLELGATTYKDTHSGLYNTEFLMNNYNDYVDETGATGSAVIRYAYNLTFNGHNDYFVPNIDELDMLRKRLVAPGIISLPHHVMWSSTFKNLDYHQWCIYYDRTTSRQRNYTAGVLPTRRIMI
jgi:hypothetical protein